jgi:calcium permeable stress-gated cation channel
VEQNPSTLSQLVPRSERPTHRLKPSWAPFSLPFIGEKVDTIDWCREEIRRCNEVLEVESKLVSGAEKRDRREDGDNISVASLTDSEEGNGNKGKKGTKDGNGSEDDMKPKEDGKTKYLPLNSAFVTFNQQIAAHIGMQVLTHHEPYR